VSVSCRGQCLSISNVGNSRIDDTNRFVSTWVSTQSLNRRVDIKVETWDVGSNGNNDLRVWKTLSRNKVEI